jgi:ABC-type dipeptide/oligopeptide/nickel transport system ATPase subunit
MTIAARQFDAKPAVRESVPLLIGLMGPSGSGKTYSALRLATGIQSVTGGDIYVIDTEARRALHYADLFKFKHVQFDPPFSSLDYLAAIQQCVKQGAKVVIVDSMSHEHEGPGGYLATHDLEVDRMAGDDYAKRERVKIAGWIKPASLRRQLINGILQLNVSLISCFRAKEKIKPVKGGQPVEMGWMPIAGDEFMYEQTVNILLLPKSGGVPTWQSEQIGERLMMKLPKQFESIFAESKPLDENIGRDLAQWAKGGQSSARLIPHAASETPTPPVATPRQDGVGVTDRRAEIERGLIEAAKQGMAALQEEWKTLLPADQKHFKAALDRRFKPQAREVDEAYETSNH